MSAEKPTESRAGHGQGRSNPVPCPDRAYEPPRLTVIGTVIEMTRGSNTSLNTDGMFPGSLFG